MTGFLKYIHCNDNTKDFPIDFDDCLVFAVETTIATWVDHAGRLGVCDYVILAYNIGGMSDLVW